MSQRLHLGTLPTSERGRELSIQHAVAFILFEDVRGWAIQSVDPSLDATARAAALKAVNDTVYGLVMVIDGVSGGLRNSEYSLDLQGLPQANPIWRGHLFARLA